MQHPSLKRNERSLNPHLKTCPRNTKTPFHLYASADQTSLAKECHYHPGELAAKLGISVRWLQRLFKKNLQMTPYALLAELRVVEICRLANLGVTGKGIAHLVGLANSHNVCRALKHDSGFLLSHLPKATAEESSHHDTKDVSHPS